MKNWLKQGNFKQIYLVSVAAVYCKKEFFFLWPQFFSECVHIVTNTEYVLSKYMSNIYHQYIYYEANSTIKKSLDTGIY